MFRSVRGLGVAFCVLVALTALMDVVLAGWVWRVHGVLQDFVDGRIGEAEFDRALAVTDVLDLGAAAAYLAAGVVFVVWLWNVRSNADLVAPDAHHLAKRWAIWGWLPVINFWFPRRVVVDVWQVSLPRHELGRGRAEVNWWWGLFIAYLVMDRIADRMLARSTNVGEFANGRTMLVVVAVLSVAAAALSVNVVRRITAWQSVPGFVTPEEIVSPSSVGPAPVDVPAPPAPPTAPPAHDPRWERPE
ncbi:DUF4328 domain-containing protein [Saccharothrix luteola]|uniref:DUF4328 domain-containing protein n=1 Tax=Saccharothrix luteola TaxID=2893018 RepID=UPI001E300359|nr:DUF4328 domain-containing protein [Saccharothrix luteola]MCC8245615.1 DUF4328 domain-containing protein [Saccharothrix luteola]